MKNKICSVISIAVLIFSSLACAVLSPGSSPAHASGKIIYRIVGLDLPGKIIYRSTRAGNIDIYSLDAGGGVPARLTDSPTNDFSPAFVPSTGQIGFLSNGMEIYGWNIYVMDIIKKNIMAVTKKMGMEIESAAWSPDGKSIVASIVDNGCREPSCNYDLYSMNADGTNFVNITNSLSPEWEPMWSPDGRKIAFSSERDGDVEIYVMDKDGSNLVQLTNNDRLDSSPRWSPDGTRLAFVSDRNRRDWDIFIMNADGSDPRPVTSNYANDYSESWSPDGKWLVYVTDGHGDNEICIINLKDNQQYQLTNNPYFGMSFDLSPIWIPDLPADH